MSEPSNIKLYHGTSERYLDSILKHGLLPRSQSNESGNWDHTVQSADDRVYLTKGYAPYFAFSAVEAGERWLILEIDKSKLIGIDIAKNAKERLSAPSYIKYSWEKFFPDEDFVENMLRGVTQEKLMEANPVLTQSLNENGYPWGGEVLERTSWIRDNIDVVADFAQASLDNLGNISWRGRIPPAAITRVSLYSPASNPAMTLAASDPTISTLNWRICRGKYEELTRWFLGYKVNANRICSLGDSVASEEEIILRRGRYKWLMEIKSEIEHLDPELYVRMDYSPDGETECSLEDAAVLLSSKGTARGANKGPEKFLNGSCTVKEVLEMIESQTAVLTIQYEQEKTWEEEILPATSGIEVLETAQTGLGVKKQMLTKQQITNSLVETTLGEHRINSLISDGGPALDDWVQKHGIEAVKSRIKQGLALDIHEMWEGIRSK